MGAVCLMLAAGAGGMPLASSGPAGPSGVSGSTGPSAASGPTGSSTATGSSGATGVTPPTPQAGLYRPVGCRSVADPRVYSHGPDTHAVAISLDDGPSRYTASFVRMFKANRVRVTFFEIGRQITPIYRATMRLALRDGDAIGDHTWSHPRLTAVSDVAAQLSRTVAAVRSMTGYAPCVFRPPYGAYTPAIVATASSLGLATVLWNVDPSDYLQPGVAAIEQRVLAQVRPGSIIDTHDGGGARWQTLAAYPYIIRALRARGYRFETVPQLLGFRTIYERCRGLGCLGEGMPGPLPRGAIVESGTSAAAS